VYASDAAEERRHVDICRQDTLAILPGWSSGTGTGTSGQGSAIVVTNALGSAVNGLFLFPDGRREHGDDLLGAATLDDKERKVLDVSLGNSCSFTLQVLLDDGERTRPGIDLCASKEITLSASLLRQATIRNDGPLPIVALHVSAPDAARGPDRLGDAVIGRGATFTLPPPTADRCDYMLAAIFRDGRQTVAPANLCGDAPVVLK
jgi:hypothetical protein